MVISLLQQKLFKILAGTLCVMWCATAAYAQYVDPETVDFGSIGTVDNVVLINDTTEDVEFTFTVIPDNISIEDPDGNPVGVDGTVTVGAAEEGEEEEGEITITLDRPSLTADLDDIIEIETPDDTFEVNVLATIPPPAADVDFNPDPIDFGAAAIQWTLDIDNNEAFEVDVEFSPPAGISVSQDVTIDAGGTESVEVTLDRSRFPSGALDEIIEIDIFDTDEGDNIGDTVELHVLATIQSVDVSVDPTSIDFGTVITQASLDLINDGTVDATFEFTSLPTGFSVEVTTIDVEADDVDSVTITLDRFQFAGGTVIDDTIEITVTDAGTGGDIAVLTVDVQALIEAVFDQYVDPTSIDFGTATTEADVDLYNDGDVDATFTFTSMPTGFTVDSDPIDIDADDDDSATITLDRSLFAGGTVIDETIEITVTDSDTDEVLAVLTVDVQALIEAVVEYYVDPTSIDFGRATNQATVDLFNDGTVQATFAVTSLPTGFTVDTSSVDMDPDENSPLTIMLDRSLFADGTVIADTIEITVTDTGTGEVLADLTVDVQAHIVAYGVDPALIDFNVTGDTNVQLTFMNTTDEDVTFFIDPDALLTFSIFINPIDGLVSVPAGGGGAMAFIDFDRLSRTPGEVLSGSFDIEVLAADDEELDTLTVDIAAAISMVQVVNVDPDTGTVAGGTDVIIYGNNFTDVDEDESEPTVLFGTELGIVTEFCGQCIDMVIDSVAVTDYIYVTTPPSVTGPGPVDVIVTNNDLGEDGDLPDGFTYGGPEDPLAGVDNEIVIIGYDADEATLQISNIGGGGILDWTLDWTVDSISMASIVYADITSGSLDGTAATDIVTFTPADPNKEPLLPGESRQGTMTLETNGGDITITVILVRATLAQIDVISQSFVSRGIYWTDSNLVQRTAPDGSGIETLVTLTPDEDGPMHLALDVAGGKMYWANGMAGKIQSSNLDGSNVEDLVTDLPYPMGIALDTAGGKMYWADPVSLIIQRSNLDGSSVQTVLEDVDVEFDGFSSLALDLDAGKIYWTGWMNALGRANLDGTDLEVLVNYEMFPTDIALDLVAGKMYWIDTFWNEIVRANLDGSDAEVILFDFFGTPFGLDLDTAAGKLYWTDWGSGMIQRANLDGAGPEFVVTGLSSPLGIALDPRIDHAENLELYYEGAVGDKVSHRIRIRNMGQEVLEWQFLGNEDLFTAAPPFGELTWFDIGFETTELLLTVDFAGLVPETVIHTTVRIADARHYVQIPVTIRVMNAAELYVTPLAVPFSLDTFSVNDDTWTMSDALTLMNLGETDLGWTAVSDDLLNVTTSPVFDSLAGGSPSMGPTVENIDVIVNSAGLPFATPTERIITRTITITGAGKSFDVMVTIERPDPPILLVVPEELDFGETLTTLLVNIQNVGVGPLRWRFVQNPAFNLSVTSGTVLAGTPGQQVAVTLNRLDLGPVEALDVPIELLISHVGSEFIPARFSVPGPVLKVDPYEITFEPGVTTKSFTITNDHKGILQWQMVTNTPRVEVDRIFGQTDRAPDSDTVNVTIDRTGLPGGVFTYFISVQTNGSIAPIEGRIDPVTAWLMDSYQIPVYIIVPEPEPVFSVTPLSIVFESGETVSSLDVTNIGVDILRWELDVQYGDGVKPFLIVNPNFGFTEREIDTVSIVVDRSELGPGTHMAEIVFTSLTGSSAPVTVPVTVVVRTGTSEPTLDVSPKSLTFELDDEIMELDVRNIGGQTLAWSATPQSPFLDVYPRSGQILTGPQKVLVKVDRSLLNVEIGITAIGSIAFISNGGEVEVPVYIETVRSGDPVIKVAPFNLAFVRGVTVQSFLIQNTGGGKLQWQASVEGPIAGLIQVFAPASGIIIGAPTQVVVVIDKTGLTRTTSGTINIFSNSVGSGNEPFSLSITVEPDDSEGPILQVRPLEVKMPSSQDFANIIVRNGGADGTTLDWTVDTAGLPFFMKVDNESGSVADGDMSVVRLRVVRSWMTPGAHRARLGFISNGGTAVAEIEVRSADVFARPGLVTIGGDEDAGVFGLRNMSENAAYWSATVDRDYLSLDIPSGVLAADDGIDITVQLDRSAFIGEVSGAVTIVVNGEILIVPVRPRVSNVDLSSPEPGTVLEIFIPTGSSDLPSLSVGDLALVAEPDSVLDTERMRFELTAGGYGTAVIGIDEDAPFTAVVPQTVSFPNTVQSLESLIGLNVSVRAVAESRFMPGIEIPSNPADVAITAADPVFIGATDTDDDGQITPFEAFVDNDNNRLLDIDRYDLVAEMDTDDGPVQIVFSLRTFMPGDDLFSMTAPDGTTAEIPPSIAATTPVQVLVITAPNLDALEDALEFAGRPTSVDAAVAAGSNLGSQMGMRCASVEVLGASAPLWVFGGVALGIPYADLELNGYIDGTTISVTKMAPNVFADGANVSVDALTGYTLDEPARRGIVAIDRNGVVTLTRDIGDSGSTGGALADWITLLIDNILGD